MALLLVLHAMDGVRGDQDKGVFTDGACKMGIKTKVFSRMRGEKGGSRQRCFYG